MSRTPNNTMRRLRQSRGMTQQQLADKATVNIRQIQRFESGERDIGNASLRLVLAISQALSATPEDLIK